MLATEFEKFGKGLPPPIATRQRETENFCRGKISRPYGPSSWSRHLQYGWWPVEVSPFDVPPFLREGEDPALSDIRPTRKRCRRSDQRPAERGSSHRHPGSLVIHVCATLRRAHGEHGIGRCLQILIGLCLRIPVWHGRLLALCGSGIPPSASVLCTGTIAPVESVCGSVPWGPRGHITEVSL